MDNWKVHLDATARSGSNITIEKYQKLRLKLTWKRRGLDCQPHETMYTSGTWGALDQNFPNPELWLDLKTMNTSNSLNGQTYQIGTKN